MFVKLENKRSVQDDNFLLAPCCLNDSVIFTRMTRRERELGRSIFLKGHAGQRALCSMHF